MRTAISGVVAILMANATTPALAQSTPKGASAPAWGGPMEIDEGITLDPILDARIRYERVDQDLALAEADAITLRLRAGAELKVSKFSLLVEGEGTVALGDSYNAFPFPAEAQNRPYSVVPDPENIELNRAQIAYGDGRSTITLGRQRINLDDQRWVGSVAWRQNEQTFDAIRAQTKLGPVSIDGTYAVSQRTIFGIDAGPRQAYNGDFLFADTAMKLGPVTLKAFAYLLNYDDPLQIANSSQTYGLLATGALPLGPKTRLNIRASYARQSDWQTVAKDYSADYMALEAGVAHAGFIITGGVELLGSDNGFALQTPLATLHKFNGWADIFLTTPAKGLQDVYGSLSYKFVQVKAVQGLTATVVYHQFNSDVGGIDYGSEWDAQIGFKLGQVGVVAKYANYNARNFGADMKRFWLQAEIAF